MDAKAKGVIMTYLGYDIFDKEPLAEETGGEIKNNFSYLGDESQKQTKYILTPEEYAFKWTYFCRDLAEAMELRAFFRQKQGRLNAFWLPSHKNDAVFAANALAGDTQVLLANAQRKYTLRNVKRHIYIKERQWAAKIMGSVMQGSYEFGRETVVLNRALPADIDKHSQPRVQYLYLVRLNTDEFRLEKYGAKFFKVTFGFKELQEETP